MGTTQSTEPMTVSLGQIHRRLEHGHGMSKDQLDTARLAFNRLATREGLRKNAQIPLQNALPLLYGGSELFQNMSLVSIGHQGNIDFAEGFSDLNRPHILHIHDSLKDVDPNEIVDFVVRNYIHANSDDGSIINYFSELYGSVSTDRRFLASIRGLSYWPIFKSENDDASKIVGMINQIQTINCPVQPTDTAFHGEVSGCQPQDYDYVHDAQISYNEEQELSTDSSMGVPLNDLKVYLKQIFENGVVHISKEIFKEDFDRVIPLLKESFRHAINLPKIQVNFE